MDGANETYTLGLAPDDGALLTRSIELLWRALHDAIPADEPKVRLAYDIWAGFASGTFLLED